MSKNQTYISELLYGQQYLHNSASAFTFMLTGNDTKPLYGMCVSKEEPVEVMNLI